MNNIDGVVFTELSGINDQRGTLTPILIQDEMSNPYLQWNLVRSKAQVLRGMHAHLHYDEYYVPLTGAMFFGLYDLRPDSPSYQQSQSLRWDGSDIAIFVPRGVAHGVFCETDFILLYGLSKKYNGRGELGCRYDDPRLGIEWPTTDPVLSDRDQNAGSLEHMLNAYQTAITALPV